MKKFKISAALSTLLITTSLIVTSCNQVPKSPLGEFKTSRTEEESILRMHLVSFNGYNERKFGTLNLGHAFLWFENISDETQVIGSYELPPKSYVSCASFGQKEFFGIWYNVDTTYIKHYNRYRGRASVSCYVNSTDLETINNYLKSHNYWKLIKNCSFIALNCFNSIIEDPAMKIKVKGIVEPEKIYNYIVRFSNHKVDYLPESEGFTLAPTIGFSKTGEVADFKEAVSIKGELK